MKIEEGKFLVETKINDLKKIVKLEEIDNRKKYFKSQTVPEIIFLLMPLIAEYIILNSDLTESTKLSYNIYIIIYSFILSIFNTAIHQDYCFDSKNKERLELLKKIKYYLDSNINVLEEVETEDFECYINNIKRNKL